jgi:hypothetical protein
MTTHHDPTEEVRALARLDLEGLRSEWRARFGEAPTLRSADLLRRNIAWRIQAEAHGGLDPQTRQKLLSKGTPTFGSQPSAGTRLAREWKGVRHEVEVRPDGVRYRGQTYSSLSQVARAITGSRWNGPRFFGLRPGEKETA